MRFMFSISIPAPAILKIKELEKSYPFFISMGTPQVQQAGCSPKCR